MADIKIRINATGAKQGAAEVSQSLDSIAQSAVRSVQSLNQIQSSLKRQQDAQAQARTATVQQSAAIQQKLAVERQAISSTTSLAQATRRMAEADTQARTGNRQLAQQLASTRAEFDKNAASIAKLGQGASAAGTGLGSLKGSILAAAASFVSLQTAGKFISIADEVSSLRARIDNLTGSTGQSALVFERLQASAKELGVPLASAVDLFSRLTFGTKALGASNADILKVAVTLQQIGVVSKISTENLNSALTQLGQIFTQGKFQADELNVILAQAPDIVAAIAKGMGITTDELLKLRAEGKLTIDDTFRALLKVSGEFNAKFEALPATVSRATQTASVTIGQAIDSVNQKFALTETIAKGILNLAGRISEALNLDSEIEKLERARGRLKDLEATQVPTSGVGGFIAGVRGDEQFRLQNIENLKKEIEQLEAVTKKTDAALAKTADTVNTKTAPALSKEQEGVEKLIKSTEKRAATLNLEGEALANVRAQQARAEGATAEQAERLKQAIILEEKAKATKEANTKATQKKAQAEREANELAKAIAADEVKREEFRLDLVRKQALADQEAAKASADNLVILQNELVLAQEEGRLINGSLAPKEEVRRIELEIAKARINRQAATKLVTDGERTLTQAEKDAIEQTRLQEIANLDAAESFASLKTSIDDAALSTADLKTFTQGILSGTQDIGSLFEDLGQTLGTRLIEGVLFGKGQDEQEILGNFNDLLGIGAQGIFQTQGGSLGNTLVSSIVGQVGSLGSSLLGKLGIDLGGVFGGAFSSTGAEAASGIFSNVVSGGSSTAAAAGFTLGQAFGGAAAGAAGTMFGKGVAGIFGLGGGKGGKIGGDIGGALGGGAGFLLGGPLGAGIGSAIGGFFGSIVGGLFKSKPSKGTEIRKDIKDLLKDLEVSFASEIDASDYFFEETKKLAKKMFGGDGGKDFLKASKQILNDEIGPELAKQLQALGTFLTADKAGKLNKSVEQTGTTFGNLLLDNLGVNPDVIDSALQEVIQKAGITFESLADKLNEVFQDKDIGVEFYTDAIIGAVDIFNRDVPQAINVAKLAVQSFGEDGLFSVEKFQEALLEVGGSFDLVTRAFLEAVQSTEPGVDVGVLLGKQIQEGLAQIAIDAFLTKFIDERLFEDIDLTDGLGAEEIAKVVERAKEARVEVESLRQAFGIMGETATDEVQEVEEEVEDLTEKLQELYDTLRNLSQQRFDLRLSVLSDLESVGAVTGTAGAQGRIGAARGVLSGLGAGTRTDFSNAELDQGLEAVRSLRAATVELFQAQEQEAQAALQQRVQDIQADFAARKDSLQRESEAVQEGIQRDLQAREEAIEQNLQIQLDAIDREAQAAQELSEARIEALGVEREQTQELFGARLDNLKDELQIAEDFRRVADGLQQTINGLVQSASPFSKQEQLGVFQRQAAELRDRIGSASREDRPALIQELSGLLSTQLSLGKEVLDPTRFANLFTQITGELEQLRNQASAEGDRAESIQQQIADTSIQMELALKSIDARIEQEQQRADVAQEIAQEQANVARAIAEQQMEEARAFAEQQAATARAFAEQQAAELAQLEQETIARATEETTQQIQALRVAAVEEIRNLALIEDAILAEQQRRVEAEIALLGQQLALSAEQLNMLAGIRGGIVNLENSLITILSGIISAQTGYEGVTTRPQLFLAHANERVSITPAGQSTGPISVTIPLTIGVAGGGNNPTATEEAIIQAVADDLRKGGKIRNAMKGVR